MFGRADTAVCVVIGLYIHAQATDNKQLQAPANYRDDVWQTGVTNCTHLVRFCLFVYHAALRRKRFKIP